MSVVTAQHGYPHIGRDPAVADGQPVVAGTRIPVITLVRAHQFGLDFDEILVQYPSLRPADLHAAILYYLDHKDEMDALLTEAATAPPGTDVVEP